MWCFAGIFAKNGCANRGFLRGKRGEVVVNCVAGSDSKSALKNGTARFSFFRGFFRFGLVEVGAGPAEPTLRQRERRNAIGITDRGYRFFLRREGVRGCYFLHPASSN
jgi:hypothetical protein